MASYGQIRRLGRASEHYFGPRGAGILTIQSSKVQMPVGEGKLKFRVDRRILFGKGGKNFKTILNCSCKPRE